MNSGDRPLLIHANKESSKANTIKDDCVEKLQELNENSEGLFLLEHIVLMPKLYKENFGFTIDFSKLDSEVDLKLEAC